MAISGNCLLLVSATSLLIVLLCASSLPTTAQTESSSNSNNKDYQQQNQLKQAQMYNNLDNLISEFFGADGRLKKSARTPAKHTLRFGRSDPDLAPRARRVDNEDSNRDLADDLDSLARSRAFGWSY